MMRSQKGIVGAGDETELHEQEQVSAFQYLSMIMQSDMDTMVDESEDVMFGGHSYEVANVLVPPSESEDCDLNDSVLKYITEILMEEDVEKEFQESAALQASEKSFYDVLHQEKMAPPQSPLRVPDIDQNVVNQDENYEDQFSIPEMNTISDEFPFLNWVTSPRENAAAGNELTAIISESATRSFFSPSTSVINSSTTFDGSVIFPDRTLENSSMFSNSETMKQFNKGVEEARKFLPDVDGIVTSVRPVQLQEMVRVESRRGRGTDVENRRNELSHDNLRTRKYPDPEDGDLHEGRRNKQSAVFTESTVGPETFDLVLLQDGEETGSPEHETFKSGESVNDPKVFNPKGSSGGKSRGKTKKGGRRKSVNLKELLISCAQAVAAEDIGTANQFLKQIREHCSQTGDGMQRLAHYFARGLEARISGIGNNIRALAGLPPSASVVLTAYQLYLAACPFRRVSNFFSNRTIMNVSEKATRLHIIHFGVLYGFQWPSLMQRLSSRPDGPPRLRITGIDIPRPGLKPAERVEETGRRLANYAGKYNIPFEFNAIAQNWETIKLEDLKLEEGEVLAVNCLYRMRILYDESVMTSSPRANNPRNNVLNLIRKTNPDVFVLGVVNGAYNSPFFITRFREALFHFSSIFDMLDANIPCDIHGRMLMEKLMFGRQAVNVIACEAGERVERPETYKQWQVRNIRAGLSPLPLNEEITKMAMQHVKISYHKDFTIIADGHWLVQGWRGRNLFALSSWKSAN